MPTAADETFTRIDYLARVMKAPRIRESARRLADQAAAQAWTGPQYEVRDCFRTRDPHG